MQIFDNNISNANNSNQCIHIYISQIELEMGIESQRSNRTENREQNKEQMENKPIYLSFVSFDSNPRSVVVFTCT